MTAVFDIYGPERGEAARDYLRRRVTRHYFTEPQWQAVVQVIESADPAVKLDELQQSVCRTRLKTYRSNHA
ncbi:hypothetical protein [Azotobacter chroococcum]|uniref:hypothetical protein n=1 Tax=Azotobacter chroococcum TaxID=353 RepID=UPI0010AE4FF5|nr:hypothetical protein [Azotobacter chroococcum]TKD39929.1 hypothetical protein FCG41_11895 [Azotobacter chroococcum]